MDASRILVVTPTLGNSPWLHETAASVRKSIPGSRHVFVCPEPSVEILRSTYSHVEVINEKKSGIYSAINDALAGFTDWDAFTYINDDDLLLSDFSRVANAASPNRPEIHYGTVHLIDSGGTKVGKAPVTRFHKLLPALYRAGIDPVYQHGMLVTRMALDLIGQFDDAYSICGDSDFLARASIHGVRFHYHQAPVGAFRLQSEQLSKHWQVLLAERKRVNQKLKLASRFPESPLVRMLFLIENLPVYLRRLFRSRKIRMSQVIRNVR